MERERLVYLEVSPEVLVLKVLGEVDLGLGLVYGDHVPVGDSHHVHLLLLDLLASHRPLSDADCDLVTGGENESVKILSSFYIFTWILDRRPLKDSSQAGPCSPGKHKIMLGKNTACLKCS